MAPSPRSHRLSAVIALSWCVPTLAATSGAEPERLTATVSAREDYRVRTSGDPAETSQDVRATLDASLEDGSGRWRAQGSGVLFWTLQRELAPLANDGLATVYDARNPFVDVFHLYGEYRSGSVLRQVRVGRQQAEHGRPATFDGASFELRPGPAGLSLFAFGGRSQHFFELNPLPTRFFGDWIAAAGAGYRITPALRLEADYRFTSERVVDPSLTTVTVRAHSYGLAAWWRPAEAAWLRASVRGLGSRVSEVSIAARSFWERPALGLDARLFVQPTTLQELDELDNPLLLTLGQSLPHARWKLDAYRAFTLGSGALEAHAGWAGRQLLFGQETLFNRNTNRVYLLAVSRDLGLKGLSASVSLDRVTDTVVPFLGQGLLALNAAVSWERDPWRVDLGTQYDRYHYAYFRDVEELADVRSGWVEVRVRPLTWLAVRARYTVEVFDRTRHTFLVSLSEAWSRGRATP